MLETRPWVKEFYKSFLGLRRGIRVVEVGCGTGDLTRYLAQLIGGPCEIVGVDMRGASLRTAMAETRRAGLAGKMSFKKGVAYDVPLPDNYADLVVCRTLLMHLTEPVTVVREMARVSRRNGFVAAIERSQMHSFHDPSNAKFT